MNTPQLFPFHPASGRRAFAFTEILFAVMILGLGFIMIAAMFPVTISQTQATVQETAAAGTARAAYESLARLSSLDKLDATGNGPLAQCPLWPINAVGGPQGKANVAQAWAALAGNFINSQNPRYGWTALYRRSSTDNGAAQVIIITTQNRSRGEYLFPNPGNAFNDILRPKATVEAVLEPKLVYVTQINVRADGADIYINPSSDPAKALSTRVDGVVAEGAYLVLADVSTSSNPLPKTLNGRIIQLGPRVNFDTSPTAPLVFKAQAGSKLLGNENFIASGNKGVTAYVVGRGYSDAYLFNPPNPPDPQAGDFTGNVQDVGVYTGFISIP
jgi:hypothetical protein